MKKQTIPCDRRNYGSRQGQAPEYIVIHYTAGDGDRAEENGRYFSRTCTGASAHWFVDEGEAVASVPEGQAAWHCGAAHYIHPDCRNENSIGVELCSRKEGDRYLFSPQTVQNAITLVRALMQRYRIAPERVLRHYDVTGKGCPAPFLEQRAWDDFRRKLMEIRYDTLEQIPVWGQATAEKLIGQNILRGDGASLDLSRDMLRLLVILDRAGAFAP